MAEASDTLSAPADQREFSQHPATPPVPSEQASDAEHPFGLRDLQEAREVLRREIYEFDALSLDEMQGISSALNAMALLLAGAGECLEPKALSYLAGKLEAAVDQVADWHRKVHALAVIVREENIRALDDYPLLLPKPEEA